MHDSSKTATGEDIRFARSAVFLAEKGLLGPAELRESLLAMHREFRGKGMDHSVALSVFGTGNSASDRTGEDCAQDATDNDGSPALPVEFTTFAAKSDDLATTLPPSSGS